jgi:hypothetical protein
VFLLKLTVHSLFTIETAETALVVYLAFMDLVLNSETSFNVFGVSGVILLGLIGKRCCIDQPQIVDTDKHEL